MGLPRRRPRGQGCVLHPPRFRPPGGRRAQGPHVHKLRALPGRWQRIHRPQRPGSHSCRRQQVLQVFAPDGLHGQLLDEERVLERSPVPARLEYRRSDGGRPHWWRRRHSQHSSDRRVDALRDNGYCEWEYEALLHYVSRGWLRGRRAQARPRLRGRPDHHESDGEEHDA